MTIDNSRRAALVSFGALAVGAAAVAAGPSSAAMTERFIPPDTRKLSELMDRLRRAPRRRDFKTVPMILQHPDFWDNEALTEIIAYRGTRKQVWNNTALAGPFRTHAPILFDHLVGAVEHRSRNRDTKGFGGL